MHMAQSNTLSHQARQQADDDDFVMVNQDDTASSYLAAISDHVDALSDELRRISLEIHDNPELQYSTS